jgi:hypothetical protein
MIDVDLTPEAYVLVREGVTAKSRRGRTYKVLMPRKLADKLNGLRDVGEDMSHVILRLAREANTQGLVVGKLSGASLPQD